MGQENMDYAEIDHDAEIAILAKKNHVPPEKVKNTANSIAPILNFFSQSEQIEKITKKCKENAPQGWGLPNLYFQLINDKPSLTNGTCAIEIRQAAHEDIELAARYFAATGSAPEIFQQLQRIITNQS